MKKKLLLLVMMSPIFSYAQEVWMGGIEFTINGEVAIITDCDESIFNGVLATSSITYNDVVYPVTSIGEDAFYECSNISYVNMPEVTNIGDKAFYNCANLKGLNLPNLEDFGSEVFMYCFALHSIGLPDIAPSIESNTFLHKGEVNIYTPSIEISGYTEDNGYGGFSSIGYSYDGDPEFSYSISIKNEIKQATMISIKDPGSADITTVDKSELLYEGELIPITGVGYAVFSGCESLTSVSFPEVTSLSNHAFAYCPSITDLSLPKLTSIGEMAFNNSGLTSADFPLVTSVGPGAFSTCSKLVNANLPMLKSIESWAFNNCVALESINISSATSVGERSFHNCQALSNVSLPEATSIGYWAFSVCKALKDVNLPKAISIMPCAFSECEVLSSVSLPETNSIGECAFSKCQSLSYLSMPKATSIGNWAFVDCITLNSISLPEATSVGEFSFVNCVALASASMPKVISVGSHAFYTCSSLEILDLPEATSIGDWCYYKCISLTSINLPKITSLSNDAFSNCTALTSVNLPLLTSIQAGTFSTCTSLKSISLPKVTDIDSWAFYDCASLESVDILLATSIGQMSFYSCSSLSNVSFPMMATIGLEAFSNCSKLTSVDLPLVAPSIEEDSFGSLRSNISIYVPRGYSGYTDINGWSGFKYIGPLSIEMDNIKYDIDNASNSAIIVGISDRSIPEAIINNTIKYEDKVYDVAFHQQELVFSGCSNLSKLTMPKQALPLSIYTFSGLDKGKISIYVDALQAESTGYTPQNGYDGFKEILYSDTPTGISANEICAISAFVDETGKLHIDGINDITKISVFDSMGNLVTRVNKADLDIQLATGVYFVKVDGKTIKVVAL